MESFHDAMTPRSNEFDAASPFRVTWRRCVVELCIIASCSAFGVECALPTGYRPPASPRSYQILITRQDSLSRAIGKRLTRRGFTVRKEGKRGGSPTAYLLSFTRREAEPGSPLWLYVRLTDTRTGALVAAVSAPLDSLGSTTDARAQAIVDSLTRVALRSGGRSLP